MPGPFAYLVFNMSWQGIRKYEARSIHKPWVWCKNLGVSDWPAPLHHRGKLLWIICVRRRFKFLWLVLASLIRNNLYLNRFVGPIQDRICAMARLIPPGYLAERSSDSNTENLPLQERNAPGQEPSFMIESCNEAGSSDWGIIRGSVSNLGAFAPQIFRWNMPTDLKIGSRPQLFSAPTPKQTSE